MPLIIITGTPCSGKTFRAQQIAKEFESRIHATTKTSSPPSSSSAEPKRSVLYVPSHHASLDPPQDGISSYEPPLQASSPREIIYDSARLEKTARAEEFSAIKRAVSKNAIVIADAPNYIKGFRYQLYCEAKAAGTRSVVVHTAAREDECLAWNNARLEAWGWEASTDNTGVDVEQRQGPKIGKDVLGELQPESHTALYGDSMTNGATGSRSSSIRVNADDDEQKQAHKQPMDDRTTLKSLYISDFGERLTIQSTADIPTSDQVPEAASQSASTEKPYPLPRPDTPSPKASLPYSPHALKSLLMRYEPPSPFTRWDTPLFTVPSTDLHPPYDAIWSAIFPPPTKPTAKKALLRQRQEEEHVQKMALQTQSDGNSNIAIPKKEPPKVEEVRQNAATVLPASTAPNALQILESTTGEIAKLVLSAAREAGVADVGEGGEIGIQVSVPEADGGGEMSFSLAVPETIALSQPSLQRLRRKFTQMQRGGIAHGQGYTQGRRNIAETFVDFLEAEWAGSI